MRGAGMPYRDYLDKQLPGGTAGGGGGGGMGGFSGPSAPPSPGLGTGTPPPYTFEDRSMAYPGREQDPLLALLTMLLNRRFPNGM